MRHFRILISCLVLAAATSWGMFGNSDPQTVQQQLPYSQGTSKERAESEIADTTAEATPVPESDPQPTPSQPAPEPEVAQWQGEPDFITTTPAQIPVLLRVPTDQPVIFLGIDDGVVKSQQAWDWLTSHHLPFTLFLEDTMVRGNYNYFRSLRAAGMTIEDHTITHPDLTTLTLEQQKAEICGTAERFLAAFGARPTLFRPPYGSYNQLTRQAAAECGMKALIIWHATVNSGTIQYQDGNTHFLPGDIVLMHFRPEFLQDMKAFTDQAAKDGLQVGRLEDWIQ